MQLQLTHFAVPHRSSHLSDTAGGVNCGQLIASVKRTLAISFAVLDSVLLAPPLPLDTRCCCWCALLSPLTAMPRAAAHRGKRKAAAAAARPATSSSSFSFSDTLQLPKRPRNASSKRVYAAAPRAMSPLLSPKLPLPLTGKDDDQPPLELPSELDSELLPSSSLSTSPERFLSPNKAYITATASSSTLSPAPVSPFRSSPSSPGSLGLTRTPNKRRFSPSSDAAFWNLSPLSNARSQFPPRHSTPRSPLDSPASTALFRSPHTVTPRTARRLVNATFSSPSPSRVRSLAPSLSHVAAADHSLHLPLVLPSPLGERDGSGDSMQQQQPTPRTLFLAFPWNTSSSGSGSAVDGLSTPSRSLLAPAGTTELSPSQQPGEAQDEQPGSAVEYGEDSVDSLASVFSRSARSNPLVPLFFSPSRSVSNRSNSLISSRTQLRTPSSSHSRASTSSCSSSKKTSFSILASSSPAELSCVALQAVTPDSTGSGKARQRLSFAAAEAQQPQQPVAATSEAVVPDEPAVKEEPSSAMVKDAIAPLVSSLSTSVRSRITEFIMADDGLMEQPTAEGEADKPLLFAYRASADGRTPSELFPASPLTSSLPSTRPRSYTFATRKDGKVNVSTTPPFSRLDRLLISPSSAALFTPPSPSPSTVSSHGAAAGGGAVLPMSLPSFTHIPLSFARSEHDDAPSSAAASTPSALHASTASSDVISVDGQPVKAKSCNCKKSQCLKLYCECFAHGRACVDCNCTGCHNTDKPEHQQTREKAIAATRERDSNAFYRAAPLQAKAEKMKADAANKAAAAPASSPSPAVLTDDAVKTEVVAVPPKRSSSAASATTQSAVSSHSVVKSEPAILPAALPVAFSASAAAAVGSTASTPSSSADGAATSAAAAISPPAAANSALLPARKGCNCKKSKCLKKYCECFQLGIKCTAKCKCLACLNGNHSHQHEPHDDAQRADDKSKEPAEQQSADAKEPEDSGSAKEDRVRGAFLQVKVESHLACSGGVEAAGGGQSAAGEAAAASAGSLRPTVTPSKLSAWRLFPGGSTGSSASVPPLSNAPPIPVQPLAPFTLPAPFEIFHQLKREVMTDSDVVLQS